MRLAERILNPSDQTLKYVGPDDFPKWVKEGTLVKVKTVAKTRLKGGYGIPSSAGRSRDDDRVYAGEIGKVGIENGNGWWSWIISFDRGRDVSLITLGDDLDYFVKYTPKKT